MANTIYTVLGNNEGYGSAEYSSKLFTARTEKDVAFVTSNREYPFPAKGAYNAEDLSRINEMFKYLQNKMNGEYGFDLNLTIKTDWTQTDSVTESNVEAYRRNVVTIRNALAMPANAPQSPDSMKRLTYEQANDIEKILQTVENLLNKMPYAWRHSGVNNSGQGGLIL